MAAATSTPAASQLDVVFDGTWVIAPSIDANNKILGVNIYSPACGHPHGAYFTNQLDPNPWPQPPAFYMLDNHGYSVVIQRSTGQAGMDIAGIDQTINHCVTVSHAIGSNWDLMVSIDTGPDAWTSSDTVDPQSVDPSGKNVPCFGGNDAPKGKVSSLQILSFKNITNLQICGAPSDVQGLLPAPWSGSGTLIFEGEIPYVPTLQHERAAIAAMADLVGLDLVLNYPLPSSNSAQLKPQAARPMLRSGGYCGASLFSMP
jgi:hypothetical protein